jgi:hypothetical protein
MGWHLLHSYSQVGSSKGSLDKGQGPARLLSGMRQSCRLQ